MEPDLAFILGALEDGCLSCRLNRSDYTIEFDQKNFQWLEVISKKFEYIFNKKGSLTKTKRNFFRLRIYSKEIFMKLEKERKNIFRLILKEPKKCKVNFLRGVFDAEGSVHRNRYSITLTNKKSKVINTSIKLLHEMGINTGKIWVDKRNDVKSFSIFGKENLINFKKNIGFNHPEKSKKLSKLLSC